MKIQQEEDRVPSSGILLVLAAVLGIIALCVLSAWLIDDCRTDALGPRAAPTPLEGAGPIPEDIHAVELILFDKPAPALVDRALQAQRLHTYGWVSQEDNVVHIPIERAMQLYVDEHRSPRGGTPLRRDQVLGEEKP